MVDYDDLKLCAMRLSRCYEAGSTEGQAAMLTALAQCTEEEAQAALEGGYDLVLDLLSSNPSEQVVSTYIDANGLHSIVSESH